MPRKKRHKLEGNSDTKLPFAFHEPLVLDPKFYQHHYIRALRWIILLSTTNALMLVYGYLIFLSMEDESVYATTTQGKLYKLERVNDVDALVNARKARVNP